MVYNVWGRLVPRDQYGFPPLPPALTNQQRHYINTAMGMFVKAIERGNIAEASRALRNLNATGGANNRRYQRLSAEITATPVGVQWLQGIRNGRPSTNPYFQSPNFIRGLKALLAVNAPNTWTNNPNANRALNAAHTSLINSLNRENWSGVQRAVNTILRYSRRQNAVYPYTSRGVSGNWLASMSRGQRNNNSRASANLIRRLVAQNRGYTIANFNRAPPNRNTLNLYANKWFGVNIRDQRLMPSLLRNLNAARAIGGNGATKQRKLSELYRRLSSAPGGRGNTGGAASGGQRSPYTLNSLRQAPPTRNTLSTYANAWFGVTIPRNGNLRVQIAREIHPNKGNQNPNSNNFKKRNALTKLFNELRNAERAQ